MERLKQVTGRPHITHVPSTFLISCRIIPGALEAKQLDFTSMRGNVTPSRCGRSVLPSYPAKGHLGHSFQAVTCLCVPSLPLDLTPTRLVGWCLIADKDERMV
jgi:hypothetical protein